MSSARNAEEKSGALIRLSGGFAYPSVHASAVTEKIAARNASGWFRRISTVKTERGVRPRKKCLVIRSRWTTAAHPHYRLVNRAFPRPVPIVKIPQ